MSRALGYGPLNEELIDEYNITSRFINPGRTELTFSWWDRHVNIVVYRESQGHQVLIERHSESVWRVHMCILLAFLVLAVPVLTLVGMPFLMAMLFFLVSVVVIMLLIYLESYFKNNSLENSQLGKLDDTILLDAHVWENIKLRCLSGMESLHEPSPFMLWLTRQSYNFEVGYGQDATLANMPKFVTTSMTRCLRDFYEWMTPEFLEQFHREVVDEYMHDISLALERGDGARSCGCCACYVLEESDEKALSFGIDYVNNIARQAKEHGRSDITFVNVPGHTVGSYIDTVVEERSKHQAEVRYNRYQERKEKKVQAALDQKRRYQAKENMKKIRATDKKRTFKGR